MKQDRRLSQIIAIVSLLAVLIGSVIFDQWQDSLKEKMGETFDYRFAYLRLWSVPIATVFVAICVLLLFRLLMRQSNKYTAVLFLVIGLGVVFYPAVSMTVRWAQALRISVNYFADSLLFFTGALLSAMGLIGTIAPAKKATE